MCIRDSFPTLDDAAAYVKKVDEDDGLWWEIMSRPWKTPEQEALFLEETERETAKLYRILDVYKRQHLRMEQAVPEKHAGRPPPPLQCEPEIRRGG